jgi:hypothetical protein
MIGIKRIKRLAVAVKDLDAAIENWKKLYGIKPFLKGSVPEDRYAFCAFHIGNTWGDGETSPTTIEFLSPINDPNGEMLIGKFIKNRGEGLYMITLETAGSSEEVDVELEQTGLQPSWGGKLKQWKYEPRSAQGYKTWTEHYVSPRDANGVLCTLASIEYADPVLAEGKKGITIPTKKGKNK